MPNSLATRSHLGAAEPGAGTYPVPDGSVPARGGANAVAADAQEGEEERSDGELHDRRGVMLLRRRLCSFVLRSNSSYIAWARHGCGAQNGRGDLRVSFVGGVLLFM